MAPTPAASAVADPEIPANTIEVITLTWLKPPGTREVKILPKPMILRVTPPLFINWPVRMNRGTAISGNESSEL